MTLKWIRPLALVAVTAITGCSYTGSDITNPLTRKFEWFSFLGGDDIRAACMAGAPDRFRLIYNGIWREQLRIYEIGASGPRQLDEHVLGAGNLFELTIGDPLAPWRGNNATVTVSDEQYGALTRALADSGAYVSPLHTLTLTSTDFYWVAASCRAGVFHLTAWVYPSEGFSRLKFPPWLAALDQTGVAFNPPRPWTEVTAPPLGSADNPARGSRGSANTWTIGIAEDRLVDQIVF